MRGVAVAIAIWLLGSPVSGEEPARDGVEVTFVAEATSDPEFERRLSSWFDASRFAVTVRRSAQLTSQQVLSPSATGVIYVWVVVHSDAVYLYFSRAELGRDSVYLTRRLDLGHGFDEVAAERTAQVVHLSSLAMLEGQPGMPRSEVQRHLEVEVSAVPGSDSASGARSGDGALGVRSADTAAARAIYPTPSAAAGATRPRPLPRLHPGIGYGMGHRFDEGLAHGPRGSLEFDWDIPVHLRLGVQSFMPTRSELDGVSLETYGAGVSAAVSLGAAISKGFHAHAFVGPGVHVIFYRAHRSADLPELSPEEGHVEGRPVVEIGLGAIAGGGYPNVAFVAELAIALSRTRYVVNRGGDEVEVGRGPALVPMMGVEVRF